MDPATMAAMGALGGGGGGMGGGGWSFASTDTLGFNSGPTSIKTGANYNFGKGSGGLDLSGPAGWALLGVAALVAFLLLKKGIA